MHEKRNSSGFNNGDYENNGSLVKAIEELSSVLMLKYQLRLAEVTIQKGDKLLDKYEVKARLKISPRTYYRYKSQKILVPIKIGGRDFYYESDLPKIVEKINEKGGY